ncbi:uncharacterized protein LY89DRAFT_458520 [Mollisia scopiformis]|uniref:Uncharacterized protein n=1 Tax=Mollisia scopiformis TaxID=149040 RepID=A0A194XHT3_MOLSC|nr:uncharacterized protein LY89DRAFT_458520 [Mollisia scopiformis]KUJ19718.1 hypothetical protein LY89DRAFT_458520 [Mollisia scopiformis]
MPPKRKAPLATSDNNIPTKKVAKGKKSVTAQSSSVAGPAKKYKFSNPSTLVGQEPVDVITFLWGDDTSEEETEDEYEVEDAAEPGSLQYILDGIENQRSAFIQELLNPLRSISHEIYAPKKAQASEKYDPLVKEAREKFVEAGTMTAEEAEAIVGVDDGDKKQKRIAKQALQRVVNKAEKERLAAVELVLKGIEGNKAMLPRVAREFAAEASRPWLEKMEEARKYWMETTYPARRLTTEEANAITPDLKAEEEREAKEHKKAEEARERRAKIIVPRIVTDKGFPVTKAGIKRFREMNLEVDKRNPDLHDMYIYNDFLGYGVKEILENALIEFNKIIFKQDISPTEKWALVESVTLFLTRGDSDMIMAIDDPDSVEEAFDMTGVMFITALEMLHEHNLIGTKAPLPDNSGVMTLLFLEFMRNTAGDFELQWVHEIVRSADLYGVNLNSIPQIAIDELVLDEYRDTCDLEKRGKGFAWKTEFPKFKRTHPGGHEYDITKMSEFEKAQYSFGNGDDSD